MLETYPNRVILTLNDPSYFLSHRLELAETIREMGCSVHVAGPQGPETAEIDSRRFPYHTIPMTRRGMRPWEELSTVQAIVRLYRDLNPDLVHHLTVKPILYGSVAARVARVPAVVNAVTGLGHVFVSRGIRKALLRRGIVWGYRLAFSHPNHRIIFQNPDDMERFQQLGLATEATARLIRSSGVDTSEFTPLPEPEAQPLIILASRMLWDKGVGEFVGAARLLNDKGVQARFALVGDSDPGNPSSVSQAQLREWDRGGHVEWWGWEEDMREVFEQSHIVCLPSKYGEGVPKVLLEAAACARPIVTTDTPGCREIVEHGENGLLIPVGDSRALASALRKLIESPRMRRRMGRRGRDIVEARFAVEKVVSETIEVYREL